MEGKRLLIDMDNVLADFEKGFVERFMEWYPEIPVIKLEDRITPSIMTQYNPQYSDMITSVLHSKGFYRSLPLVFKSKESLEEMKSMGHTVVICTSPLLKYYNCVLEKYEWVESKLGKEWIPNMVLTRDKTAVKGHYLIDDKPKIEGDCKPEWQHIIFDKPYNRLEENVLRINWDSWKDIFSDTTLVGGK